MLLTWYITCIIITQGYYGTLRGDFSTFKILILTHQLTNSANFVQLGEAKCICSWPSWKMAAILDFQFPKSDRTDLISSIEISHANVGACITICTIHPKNATYLLHCKKCQKTPFFFHMAYFCSAWDDARDFKSGMLKCNTIHTTRVRTHLY